MTAASTTGQSPTTTDPTAAAVEKLEVGKHVVHTTERGEEVGVREVLLGSVEQGEGFDNIYFEDGIHYTESVQEPMEQSKQLREYLHPIDAAVLLALCLDVSNSNPQVRLILSAGRTHPVLGRSHHGGDGSLHPSSAEHVQVRGRSSVAQRVLDDIFDGSPRAIVGGVREAPHHGPRHATGAWTLSLSRSLTTAPR